MSKLTDTGDELVIECDCGAVHTVKNVDGEAVLKSKFKKQNKGEGPNGKDKEPEPEPERKGGDKPEPEREPEKSFFDRLYGN
jgi:hypothetical protein